MLETRAMAGADLEGRTRRTPPVRPYMQDTNINLRPRFSPIIYTVAPPGSIFSGSTPGLYGAPGYNENNYFTMII